MADSRLQLQQVRPGICYGALRDVFLLYYRDAPTLEDLRTRAKLIASVLKDNPGGMAFLSVIDAPLGVAFPSAEVRAETGRQLASAKGHLRAGAMVITGGAVKVSLTRMLLSRLPSMIRGDAEMRFFTEVDEAALWCLEQLGVEPSERDDRACGIVLCVDEMKAETGDP